MDDIADQSDEQEQPPQLQSAENSTAYIGQTLEELRTALQLERQAREADRQVLFGILGCMSSHLGVRLPEPYLAYVNAVSDQSAYGADPEPLHVHSQQSLGLDALGSSSPATNNHQIRRVTTTRRQALKQARFGNRQGFGISGSRPTQTNSALAYNFSPQHRHSVIANQAVRASNVSSYAVVVSKPEPESSEGMPSPPDENDSLGSSNKNSPDGGNAAAASSATAGADFAAVKASSLQAAFDNAAEPSQIFAALYHQAGDDGSRQAGASGDVREEYSVAAMLQDELSDEKYSSYSAANLAALPLNVSSQSITDLPNNFGDDEKVYGCGHCGFGWGWNEYREYTAHMRAHDPFECKFVCVVAGCDIPNHGFVGAHNLRRHIIGTHMDKSLFSCEVCGQYKSNRKDQLIKHLQRCQLRGNMIAY